MDRSLLSWDGVTDWAVGSEFTALGSVECDRFVVDCLRSGTRLLTSEVDDLLRPATGTDRVGL